MFESVGVEKAFLKHTQNSEAIKNIDIVNDIKVALVPLAWEGRAETNPGSNNGNLDDNRLTHVKRSCKSIRKTTTQCKEKARALTNNSQDKSIND